MSDIHKFYQEPLVLAPIGGSDHCTIVWSSKVQLQPQKVSKRINVRPLKSSSLLVFEQFIQEYYWSGVLSSTNVNDKVNSFLEEVSDMVDIFFPLKSIKVHEDDKPYINGRIKHLIRKRDKAYQSGRVEHYKTLRNLIVSEIRKSKRKFYNENIIGLHNENARKWWKSVKKIVGASRHNFTLGNVVSENMSNKQTADYINSFFTSLTKDYPRINSEWLSFGSAEYLPKISVQSMARKLSHIDVNKAPGPFDPNLKLLKMFPEYFAIPLTDIYNQSFNLKIFPEVWKISNIASVPKLQPCSTVEDLRPIALTSVLSKIQESYVMDWVLEDTRDRISDSQFGGLAGMSAVTALLFMLHKWYQAMETSKRIIRVTFLDFRKAFDLIDHNQLLKNFDDIGVRPGVISWYASYLNKRSQIALYRGAKSERMITHGGIPQGSKLGLIAFIIKVNDLPAATNWDPNDEQNLSNGCDGETVLFMDDTTLSEVCDVSNHISGTCLGNSETNVERVACFAQQERMELNAKKCKEMIIDFRKNKTIIPETIIENQPMPRVKSYKLLGIWLDDDMKWSTNTDYITKKAAKRLYLLRKLKNYGASKDDLKSFYCATIRSIVEYGAQIWHGNLTNEQHDAIERIQKRALRIIYPGLKYDEALEKGKLKSLKQRRNDLCVELIKSMMQPSHILHHLLPEQNSDMKRMVTRSSGKEIYNFYCRTERFKGSPIVFAITKYNERID